MKKNNLVLSIAIISLAGALAFFSTGCSKKSESGEIKDEKPVIVDYKPLFPLGTEIASFHNLFAENTNAVVRDLSNAITSKLGQVASVYVREFSGAVGADSESLRDSYEKYQKELFDLTGLQEAEFKWIAYSVGNIPTNFFDGIPTMPDMAAVLFTARPIDPVMFSKGLWKLIRESIREDLKKAGEGIVDPAVFEAKLDEIREIGRMEKGQWGGHPAMRLVFADPEVTNSIVRFSPILAQVGDGRLLAMASSESALKAIGDLYDGTARAQVMDPAIRDAVSGNGSTFFAFSFPRLDKFIPPCNPNPCDLMDTSAILGQLKSLSAVTGTEKDDCFLECSVGFKTAEMADSLVAQLLMLKSGLSIMVGQFIPELSLQAATMKFIDKIAVESEAGTCKVRFSIFPALVNGINSRALLALFATEEPGPEEDDTEDQIDGEMQFNEDDDAGDE